MDVETREEVGELFWGCGGRGRLGSIAGGVGIDARCVQSFFMWRNVQEQRIERVFVTFENSGA